MSLTHPQKVRRLFKTILRLHRGLPDSMRMLGDEYVKSEFKQHKSAEAAFIGPFMQEWSRYAAQLSQQLGLERALLKPLGSNLEDKMLDLFTEEQLGQLYELYEETVGKQEKK